MITITDEMVKLFSENYWKFKQQFIQKGRPFHNVSYKYLLRGVHFNDKEFINEFNSHVCSARFALEAVAPLVEREVLERAAQEMKPMLRSMISRNEAAAAIRSLASEVQG